MADRMTRRPCVLGGERKAERKSLASSLRASKRSIRCLLISFGDQQVTLTLAGGRGAQALAGLLKLLARSTCLLGSSMMG
eukprot:1149208-Pelagomonas_calceolata.AAC.6